MTWLTANLWWIWNLVILVWWLGYQFDELTHTFLVGCFIAQSHIEPGFMGKMSTLTYFLLQPGCEDYSLLDQAIEDVYDARSPQKVI